MEKMVIEFLVSHWLWILGVNGSILLLLWRWSLKHAEWKGRTDESVISIKETLNQINGSLNQLKDSFTHINQSLSQLKDSFTHINQSLNQLKDSFTHQNQSFNQLNDSFNHVRDFLSEDIKNFYENTSPIKLTKDGKKVADSTNMREWIKDYVRELSNWAKDKEEFEIYEECERLIEKYMKDRKFSQNVSRGAYNTGINKIIYMKILSIVLRDEVLKLLKNR